MHLGHNHPLNPVDHKGSVDCHEGHIPHVHILLFDMANRTGTRLLIHVPNHKTERHPQSRGVSPPFLTGFY